MSYKKLLVRMRSLLSYILIFAFATFFQQVSSDNCFEPGDGIGGTSKKLGVTATKKECLELVKRLEPTANGATFGVFYKRRFGKGPCHAEFEMTGIEKNSADSKRYQTCQFALKEVFSKTMDIQCFGEKKGKFETLEAAKTACTADIDCKGVYDFGCDDETNDIYLCSSSALYKHSEIGSCIYQKN